MKRMILVLAIALTAVLSAQAQTKECDNCHGSGLEYRECAFCKGAGYRECDFCLGKKMVRCNMCQGAKQVTCAHCNGRGGTKVKDEWRECQWCGGVGTPECEECKGTGTKVCWKCGGAGNYVCNQCNGSKVNQWQCHVCGGTGQVKDEAKTVTSVFKDDSGYSGTCTIKVEEGDTKEDIMRKATRARLESRKKQMEARGITVK